MKASVRRLSILVLSSVLWLGCDPGPLSPSAATNAQNLEEKGNSRDLRIAVIGAGASGLTAAYELQKLGYRYVTVYERENRVGGKVYSIPRPGMAIELGGVLANEDFVYVHALAKELGITPAPYIVPKVIQLPDGRVMSFGDFLRTKYTMPELVQALSNFAKVAKEYKVNARSGFAHLSSDLHVSFTEFARKKGFEPIADMMRAFLVGCGYGYYETIPAMSIMKIFDWSIKFDPADLPGSVLKMDLPPFQIFPFGFEQLWDLLATQLDVRLNSNITQVVRTVQKGKPTVQITYNGLTEEFDRVIISSQFNTIGNFLDMTPTEQELSSQVESLRYVISIYAAAGLPITRSLSIYENAFPERLGHTIFVVNRDSVMPTPPVYPAFASYQQVDWNATPAQVTATLAADVAKLGGTLLKVLIQKEWNYFPHVSTEVAKKDFYPRLESIQGKNGTYFVGGLMNFELVESTARYSRDLVQKLFK